MKITLVSIPVRDQEKAFQFYTKKLGFIKKKDTPLGGGNRWLTLVSKDDQDGPELLLEPGPNHFEPCKVFQEALVEAGMPYTQFDVDSVDAEYERLKNLGVEFSIKPSTFGTVKYAVFNDTCGNFIQIVETI
ncbi:MAG: VOC family protein [Winogradskyella sp.]|uniref:VOC family protein n=1 Tax=Winogradskyella sp. TaxID=1883156 RepID=UPI000F3ECCFC|nr:VOC family protein [Winogradskyella sp.]RNC80204.1 MAG: VOC family protein [Winogradskyella sp.]